MKARRAAKGKERATEVDEDVHSDSNEDSIYSDESEERGGRQGSEEVIEILSDDESDADVVRTHEVPDRDDAEEDAVTDDGEREEDEEDEQEQAEVEASTFPPPKCHINLRNWRNAWAGPSTYAEDFYSGGDAPAAEIIDVDAEQGEEEVDLFPPPEGATQPPVLNDAWAGPSTYAEDFYSGGDVRAVEQIIDVQSEQAEEEDEPFPPAKVAVQPTELSDAWTGPRTYAEDFYSGGDVRADAAESVNAHALPGEEDESDTPVFIPGVSDELKTQDAQTLDAEASDHADVDVLEHLYEDLDDDEIEEVVATGSPHHEEPQQERSPPPTTLRNHVDWNWPPAFSSGRTATHSGHLEVSDEDEVPIHEIVEISDDEDDEGSDTSVVYTDDVPATQSESLVESTVADRSSVMLDSTEDIVEQPDTGVEFFTELDTYTTTQETSGYMNKKTDL
ncbi:hypothetical protein A0H81_10401 [Grifola frondosa]|uniref:Uncharacterized protein n=1 Tax=Grifola frondosa TaxID=5627 RepID=A0A1C7M0U8_GRIFR|nr:hypothetical protein A0H81_10401 [Grifola frondosa]